MALWDNMSKLDWSTFHNLVHASSEWDGTTVNDVRIAIVNLNTREWVEFTELREAIDFMKCQPTGPKPDWYLHGSSGLKPGDFEVETHTASPKTPINFC